jgi:hypothetical protein
MKTSETGATRPVERIRQLGRRWAALRERPCLLYISRSIEAPDVLAVREAIAGWRGEDLDVIVASPGGDVGIAYILARELRRTCDEASGGLQAESGCKAASTRSRLCWRTCKRSTTGTASRCLNPGRSGRVRPVELTRRGTGRRCFASGPSQGGLVASPEKLSRDDRMLLLIAVVVALLLPAWVCLLLPLVPVVVVVTLGWLLR